MEKSFRGRNPQKPSGSVPHCTMRRSSLNRCGDSPGCPYCQDSVPLPRAVLLPLPLSSLTPLPPPRISQLLNDICLAVLSLDGICG